MDDDFTASNTEEPTPAPLMIKKTTKKMSKKARRRAMTSVKSPQNDSEIVEEEHNGLGI